MKNNATLAYAVLLIIGDFLALLAAFSLAYVVRVKWDHRPLINQINSLTYFTAILTTLPLWIGVHALIGLYSQSLFSKRFSEIGKLFVGSVLGILVIIGYDFVTQEKLFPARLVPVYALALGFGFLVVFRTIARFTRRYLYAFGFGVSNVIIIGNTPVTDTIGEAIRNTHATGQKVLAAVSTHQSRYFKTYRTFEDALQHIKQPIHSIIQTELFRDQKHNNEILQYAQQNHASYRFVPGNSDLFVGNITVDLFAGLPMIAVHQTALVGWGRITKRLMDIVLATVLLLITSPLFVILAPIIRVFGGGSVFFRQDRLTRFNRTFSVYKFRTQYAKYDGTTPEEAFRKMGKPELIKIYRSNGDYLVQDPRVTPIGRLLRKTSLDELPQLLNVVRGDISLVGPRALIPQELNQYEKKHSILSVKSGLTGLAQTSGRRSLSFEERRKLDVYYVQHWSFWLDLTILIKTLRVVITGNGAE